MFIHEIKEQARLDGKLHFDTGKPCSKGHDALRFTSTGTCVTCAQSWQANYHRLPETKIRNAKLQKANNQTEHRKAYMRKYMSEYYKTEKYKAWAKLNRKKNYIPAEKGPTMADLERESFIAFKKANGY